MARHLISRQTVTKTPARAFAQLDFAATNTLFTHVLAVLRTLSRGESAYSAYGFFAGK